MLVNFIEINVLLMSLLYPILAIYQSPISCTNRPKSRMTVIFLNPGRIIISVKKNPLGPDKYLTVRDSSLFILFIILHVYRNNKLSSSSILIFDELIRLIKFSSSSSFSLRLTVSGVVPI